MYKYILILGFLFCAELKAQKTKIIDSISFYGILREHAAAYDGNLEMQDNAAKVGTIIYRKLPSNWYAKAQLEYGIHIVQGPNFNRNANSVSELVENPFTNPAPFTPRLVKFKLGNPIWGTISVGKQWGVYYDIGSYTENFNAFGGAANGVYNAGTDGGWSGTGRSDKTIQYRNKFQNFDFGIQTQLNGKTQNFGIALQYNLSKYLAIGASYNSANISSTAQTFINGAGNKMNNFIAGIRYTKDNFYAGVTTSTINTDIIVLNDTTIYAQPTNGYELMTSYLFNPKLGVEAGSNLELGKQYNTFINGDYKLFHVIAGLNYFITPKTRIYGVMRLSDSQFVNYIDSVNIFALGFRYEFEFGKG